MAALLQRSRQALDMQNLSSAWNRKKNLGVALEFAIVQGL
ncbi:hypothetical protein C1H76_5922 [Elsinoe australis]|uniref:Uncharacterized protein n=1 Tax=Elsinoe australis TaxID=40998 RepID=A0A4U7AYA0_9PEZI|nr:hypothetical protein C1H76_5922 [Elsinoe australis]